MSKRMTRWFEILEQRAVLNGDAAGAVLLGDNLPDGTIAGEFDSQVTATEDASITAADATITAEADANQAAVVGADVSDPLSPSVVTTADADSIATVGPANDIAGNPIATAGVDTTNDIMTAVGLNNDSASDPSADDSSNDATEGESEDTSTDADDSSDTSTDDSTSPPFNFTASFSGNLGAGSGVDGNFEFEATFTAGNLDAFNHAAAMIQDLFDSIIAWSGDSGSDDSGTDTGSSESDSGSGTDSGTGTDPSDDSTSDTSGDSGGSDTGNASSDASVDGMIDVGAGIDISADAPDTAVDASTDIGADVDAGVGATVGSNGEEEDGNPTADNSDDSGADALTDAGATASFTLNVSVSRGSDDSTSSTNDGLFTIMAHFAGQLSGSTDDANTSSFEFNVNRNAALSSVSSVLQSTNQLALQTANSFLEQLGGASDSNSASDANASAQLAASDSIFAELGTNDDAMDSMMLAAA